jgi:ribosomal protein S10
MNRIIIKLESGDYNLLENAVGKITRLFNKTRVKWTCRPLPVSLQQVKIVNPQKGYKLSIRTHRREIIAHNCSAKIGRTLQRLILPEGVNIKISCHLKKEEAIKSKK